MALLVPCVVPGWQGALGAPSLASSDSLQWPQDRLQSRGRDLPQSQTKNGPRNISVTEAGSASRRAPSPLGNLGPSRSHEGFPQRGLPTAFSSSLCKAKDTSKLPPPSISSCLHADPSERAAGPRSPHQPVPAHPARQ